MKQILIIAAACTVLAGCETAPTEGGQKLAKQEGYAPTGTYIKRKDGQGLGPSPIGTVRKQDVEDARAMNSSGAGGRTGF